MRVVLRREAENDLKEIFLYLMNRNPTGAARTRRTIIEHIDLLASHPSLGRIGRVAGTRELVIAHTPYVAPYTVDQEVDTIYVLRVFHGARLWPADL